ncbi:putative 30S ribosomal protein S1 (plasmid) [Streptomyces sp. Tu6071]|nr:putative 30S ribosomal protein S1 [Streptomyces sp. Tu6071]
MGSAPLARRSPAELTGPVGCCAVAYSVERQTNAPHRRVGHGDPRGHRITHTNFPGRLCCEQFGAVNQPCNPITKIHEGAERHDLGDPTTDNAAHALSPDQPWIFLQGGQGQHSLPMQLGVQGQNLSTHTLPQRYHFMGRGDPLPRNLGRRNEPDRSLRRSVEIDEHAKGLDPAYHPSHYIAWAEQLEEVFQDL